MPTSTFAQLDSCHSEDDPLCLTARNDKDTAKLIKNPSKRWIGGLGASLHRAVNRKKPLFGAKTKHTWGQQQPPSPTKQSGVSEDLTPTTSCDSTCSGELSSLEANPASPQSPPNASSSNCQSLSVPEIDSPSEMPVQFVVPQLVEDEAEQGEEDNSDNHQDEEPKSSPETTTNTTKTVDEFASPIRTQLLRQPSGLNLAQNNQSDDQDDDEAEKVGTDQKLSPMERVLARAREEENSATSENEKIPAPQENDSLPSKPRHDMDSKVDPTQSQKEENGTDAKEGIDYEYVPTEDIKEEVRNALLASLGKSNGNVKRRFSTGSVLLPKASSHKQPLDATVHKVSSKADKKKKRNRDAARHPSTAEANRGDDEAPLTPHRRTSRQASRGAAPTAMDQSAKGNRHNVTEPKPSCSRRSDHRCSKCGNSLHKSASDHNPAMKDASLPTAGVARRRPRRRRSVGNGLDTTTVHNVSESSPSGGNRSPKTRRNSLGHRTSMGALSSKMSSHNSAEPSPAKNEDKGKGSGACDIHNATSGRNKTPKKKRKTPSRRASMGSMTPAMSSHTPTSTTPEKRDGTLDDTTRRRGVSHRASMGASLNAASVHVPSSNNASTNKVVKKSRSSNKEELQPRKRASRRVSMGPAVKAASTHNSLGTSKHRKNDARDSGEAISRRPSQNGSAEMRGTSCKTRRRRASVSGSMGA